MTADIDLLADRHFRPDPQGVLASKDECRPGCVLVSIDGALANTTAGQHLAWMLVNQLSRQFRVVTAIALLIPEAPLLQKVAAFGEKPTLRDSLAECIRLVAGAHIEIAPVEKLPSSGLVRIAIGAVEDIYADDRRWHVYADGWRWYIGDQSGLPDALPVSALSLGPYMAASFAAGEVFKHLRGLRPEKGAFITQCYGSLWAMALSDSWEFLEAGPGSGDIPRLPHFYLAGAGAVAQAAALTLGSSGLFGETTVIDHDALDLTNGNRYVLAMQADDGRAKVGLIERYLVQHGFSCHPKEMKWEEYVAAMGAKAGSAELAAEERQSRFDMVLSCVDKNVPRHAIQNALPRLIIGGSTDGLVAKSIIHYLGHDASCLQCFNPPEDRNEAIQAQLEKLRAMTSAQKQAWCIEHSIEEDMLARFLAPHECGKLSEADYDRFAKGEPEMSVGFVSLAAGILMASQVIRIRLLGIDDVVRNGHLVTATFARAGLRQRYSAIDGRCKCVPSLRSRWARLWSVNPAGYARTR